APATTTRALQVYSSHWSHWPALESPAGSEASSPTVMGFALPTRALRRKGFVRRTECVVITGASSGIGRATAHEFARRGANLLLVARDASGLDDVVSECEALGATAV